MQHAIMIDIETLDTKPTAAIIEIAAVSFEYDRAGDLNELESLVVAIGPDTYFNQPSFTVSQDTIDWWRQDQMREEHFERLHRVGERPEDQVARVHWWISDAINSDTEIWTQGRFDAPILEHAFNTYWLKHPWNYRQHRDLRTLFSLAGCDTRKNYRQPGEFHTALGDCRAQISAMRDALKNL